MARAQNKIKHNNRYRGSLVTPEREKLVILARPEATPPILEESLKVELDQALLAFMRHRETLKKVDIPTKRGVLLVGPPGTGKTTVLRWILSQVPEYTAILVQGESPDQLRGVFTLARDLSPSLVIIEDADLLATNRYQNSLALFLGALMTEMDGIQVNEDVMVLMTANDASEMETALIRRPGRIDRVILLPAPSSATRQQLLRHFLGRHAQIPDPEWERLSQETENLLPAALHELAKQATLLALKRQPEAPQVSPTDLREALPTVESQFRQRSDQKLGIRQHPR